MIQTIGSSFKIAIRALTLNKGRSLLTILGIVIGTASVIILIAVGNGLKGLVSQQFLNLGANLLYVLPGKVDTSLTGLQGLSTSNSKLTEEDLKLVRLVGGVESAVADLDNFVPVLYQGESIIANVGGTGEDILKLVNWSIAEGRFLNRLEMDTGGRVAVIGSKIKEKLGLGLSLGKNLLIGGDRFRVVGVFSPKGGLGQYDWDQVVYMPMVTARRFFGRKTVDLIYFKVQEGYPLNEVSLRVEATLLKNHKKEVFSIIEQSSLIASLNAVVGGITLAIAGIAAISLLVGGIGIMNIMLVTVTERTKEIGLRKALGARSLDILGQFLLEAVFLASFGGILGIALGFLGSLILGRFLATTIAPWSVLVSFSFSALVGIVFGLVPAFKAAKLDPIEALRYE